EEHRSVNAVLRTPACLQLKVVNGVLERIGHRLGELRVVGAARVDGASAHPCRGRRAGDVGGLAERVEEPRCPVGTATLSLLLALAHRPLLFWCASCAVQPAASTATSTSASRSPATLPRSPVKGPHQRPEAGQACRICRPPRAKIQWQVATPWQTGR